jgi:hypothetical protein
MNKNELKEGEIYVYQGNYINKIGTALTPLNSQSIIINYISINSNIYHNETKSGASNGSNDIRLATPEEKHWLLECIRLDKFISKEEAIKTFVPEYVECIHNKGTIGSKLELNKIYKVNLKKTVIDTLYLEDFKTGIYCGLTPNETTKYDQYSGFKPSTKKAYDAQFVKPVKEVIIPKKFDILSVYSKISGTILELQKDGYYRNIKTNNFAYLKPLDIVKKDSLYKINSVINEEGNIFMLGDMITPCSSNSHNKGKSFKIIRFRLNNDKTMICAITDTHNPYGIGIDKIEHFIEKELSPIQLANIQHPKLAILYEKVVIAQSHADQLKLKQAGIDSIVIPNETLLEKAKRLYPVGTKFKCIYQRNNSINEIYQVIEIASQKSLLSDIKVKTNNPKGFWKNIYDSSLNQWAEIIEDKPKVGDKFEFIDGHWRKDINDIKVISRIFEESVAFNIRHHYDTEFISGGTVLLKNIKIIK